MTKREFDQRVDAVLAKAYDREYKLCIVYAQYESDRRARLLDEALFRPLREQVEGKR